MLETFQWYANVACVMLILNQDLQSLFLWDSDSGVRKFWTPDSNSGPKKTWAPTLTLGPKSDSDSNSRLIVTEIS